MQEKKNWRKLYENCCDSRDELRQLVPKLRTELTVAKETASQATQELKASKVHHEVEVNMSWWRGYDNGQKAAFDKVLDMLNTMYEETSGSIVREVILSLSKIVESQKQNTNSLKKIKDADPPLE